MGVSECAGCFLVKVYVCGYGLAVSWSGYGFECMGWLYLCQDRGMKLWAGCM
jgi:hypothetical protein